MGQSGTKAQQFGLTRVQGQGDQRPVSDDAGHQHGDCRDRGYGELGVGDTQDGTEQQRGDVHGEALGSRDDEHTQREQPDEQQPDAGVLVQPPVTGHRADAEHHRHGRHGRAQDR